LWLAGLFILWLVGTAVQENVHNASEFSRIFDWTMHAYAAALAFLCCLIWRYNRRIFPVKRRNWDCSFLFRRCGGIAKHAYDGTDI
jgi:hypothetical protein